MPWSQCATVETLPGMANVDSGEVLLAVSRAGIGLEVYTLYQSCGSAPGMAESVNGELAWSCGFAAHSGPCWG